MKFKPEIPDAALPAQALKQDYSQAQNMDGIQLGEQCLYFRKLTGPAYLPYSQIRRAWLRQEEVRARMCCATVNLDQFYVVVDCGDGQERRGRVTDKASGKKCLEHISAQNPAVEIGFRRPEE